MKKFILALSIFVLGLTSVAQAQEFGVYRITIKNLTKGQFITPPLIAIHDSAYKLFTLGDPASPGLQVLAKDGATALLQAELGAVPSVYNIVAGTAATAPAGGESEVFFAGATTVDLSIVAMLASTNDAFMGGRGLSLNLQVGQQNETFLKVYDAGAEDNIEACIYIPGTPCTGNDSDTETNEGFVHPHPGLAFNGDLTPLQHAFASTVAKVTILRVE